MVTDDLIGVDLESFDLDEALVSSLPHFATRELRDNGGHEPIQWFQRDTE